MYELIKSPDIPQEGRAQIQKVILDMDTRIKKDDIAGCYAPTDYYYVDLYSDWNTNQNGKYGESKHFTKSGNEGGFETDIYVGRIPAKNIKDLKTSES